MNILWILEDALRPDHMGCYGYSRKTTPHCDRLAAEGVRFETVIATASHTLPPIISMIMGQWAATHGIVNPKRFSKWKNEELWQGIQTPLHVLRDQGFLIDGELVLRWQPLGFERDTAGNDIEKYFRRNQDRQWFFFAEPYPTHLPYNPPEEYYRMFLDPGLRPDRGANDRLKVVRSHLIVHPSGVISKLEAGEKDPLPDNASDAAHKRTAGTADLLPEDKPFVQALYDGEARVFDDLVGRWINKLEQLGILDDTLIIVTADHGEELMERGHVGHCSCNLKGTLYDESIKVPLIMRYPRALPPGRVIQRQISQIDIMPTVFDLLDLPKPSWMDGRSTLPMINGRSVEFREEVYAETTPAGWQAFENDDREIWCVRTEEWKLILYTTADRHAKRWELFNLKSDPAEINNLFDQRQDIGDGLMPKLTAYLERAAWAAPWPKC